MRCTSAASRPHLGCTTARSRLQAQCDFAKATGKGLLQGNHVHANMLVGVRIESQADPLVVRNSIFNGLHHGILVCHGGRGTIQGNTILRNRSSGIKIRADGSPVVVGNRVHDGFCMGIHVTHTGQERVICVSLSRFTLETD